MGKVYDQAYKTEICKRVVEGGEIVPTVAREIGISENTIYTWVSRYRENSANGAGSPAFWYYIKY